ncbi:MAG: diguanylate cyclase [Phycisphaeraceae bacterium]|nr:diguanylate cyclase [Phycisphaeraceae bacterium]MCW5753391.1 diguanylate cyclase [Phycisphaeraceae bacterium]
MSSEPTQLQSSHAVILVIDDSPDVHRLLGARLKSEPIDLICAADGAMGLRMARELRPTVILLDIDMPGMDGFEVLRQLKDDTPTHDIPVIMLTGMQSPQDKVTAFDLGAVDYICKPFDLTELRARVRSAVRSSRLVQMLAQRAQIDGLTGLYNRAHFDARLKDELSGCQRHARSLSLAVFDCDFFKQINDTYGHPAGDEVLIGIAETLQRECRASDIPCRYGGEEFCLIMPDTPPDDAFRVCERIRQNLGAMVWPRHPERSITVSVGLVGARKPSHELTAAEWLETADKNLYTAKQTGRNRTIITDLMSGSTLAKAG